LRLTCKELDSTDKRLDHKFNDKTEKLDSRVDSVKEEQINFTKKYDSQTQIFRSNLTQHDSSLQKHMQMIDDQRTKTSQINEKFNQLQVSLDSTKTKLQESINTVSTQLTTKANAESENNTKQFSAISL